MLPDDITTTSAVTLWLRPAPSMQIQTVGSRIRVELDGAGALYFDRLEDFEAFIEKGRAFCEAEVRSGVA